jgi:hypothetical protein
VITVLTALLAGCYVFNNPVDPNAQDYQGYLSPADLPYRRAVTVTHPGPAISDYQVAVTLDVGSMGSPYNHVNADGSDLRFRDDTGTELSYWIESWDNSGDSLVWVRVPNLPTGDTTIYLYYGDPLLTSASDPHSTFLFFDGFDEHPVGDFIDGWDPPGVFRAADDGGARVFDDVGTGQFVIAAHDSFSGVAVRQRGRSVTGTIDATGLVGAYTDAMNGIYGGLDTTSTVDIWERNAGVDAQIGITWAVPDVGTAWHIQEFSILGSTVSVSIDGTLAGSGTTTLPDIGVTGFRSQVSGDQYSRDWHLVRNYTSPEPSATVGSEQNL